MATAQQVANKIKQRQVDAINEELANINATLRKYEPLFELRRQLEAARRALLNERATTAGGGKGLTQDEIVNALGDDKLTVHEVATKLNASEGAVRAQFNRGKGERFEQEQDNGKVLWFVRDPETQEDDDEDEEDDE
jgi:hypothetical protein